MRNTYKAVTLFFMALMILAAPQVSFGEVSIGVSVSIGPPPLPVYVQPACPGPRFIWTPGYWAWAAPGYYYWVPGTWILAPQPGLLWTPGYWGWSAGSYLWYPGYWGPRVGYYGGINYGFGYTGFGYVGGYWHRGIFFYNRSVNNVNVTVIRNTYYRTVVRNVTVNRVSYNGGPGGIALHPNRWQEAYAHERHFGPTRSQELHERTARGIRALRASVNHGRPMIAATERPGVFHGRGVIPAASVRGRYQPRVTPMRPERRSIAPTPQPYNRNYRPDSRRNPGRRPQPANNRDNHFRPGQAQGGQHPNRGRPPLPAPDQRRARPPQKGQHPKPQQRRDNRGNDNRRESGSP